MHHIRTKGSGGSDIRCNLIALCSAHHAEAQTYRIPQVELLRITAHREGMTLTQVYSDCGLDPPPDIECWKADVFLFVQLHKNEEESGWKIAGHSAYMLSKYGRGRGHQIGPGCQGIPRVHKRSCSGGPGLP